MSLPIAAIVAAADNDVIGHNNALPWNLPADLAHFKRTTMGKPILMGRRTFESIGRPLPGRTNIVLTRDSSFGAEGARIVHSLEAAFDLAETTALIDGSDELVVIGGAEIYALALPKVVRLYLTRVHSTPPGDAYLPHLDWTDWKEVDRKHLESSNDHPGCTFLTYTRRPGAEAR